MKSKTEISLKDLDNLPYAFMVISNDGLDSYEAEHVVTTGKESRFIFFIHKDEDMPAFIKIREEKWDCELKKFDRIDEICVPGWFYNWQRLEIFMNVFLNKKEI